VTAHAFSTATRLPPANLEAEQALLGALLANNKAYERVAEFLLPEHFADPIHGMIYGAIQRRIEAGQLADAVTLRAEFEQNGLLDDAGGVGYLAQLLSAMVSVINAGEYGRVIEDLWLRRQLIDAAAVLTNRCYGQAPELDARAILAETDETLLSLDRSGTEDGLRDGHAVGHTVMANIAAAMARKGALPGITYGLAGLDRMTGGLRKGQFVLIAGRPSMGKTSMALRVTLGAAEAGARVLFVSAEMLAEEVLARAVTAAARLPLSAYTHGGIEDDRGNLREMTQPEVDRLAEATARLGALPIMWDDRAVTVQAIRARARKLMRRKGGGLDLIVIDYLGQLRASSRAQQDGRTEMVTELSADLKALGKQLQIPVVVLAQLNRKIEERDDKTPLLSDLRDSGGLEQDADVVIFLYREHYYLIRGRPTKGAREKADTYAQRVQEWEDACAKAQGRALAIVAKQRQGRIGPVRLRFDDANAQFRDEGPGESAED
jgi:replicative DNA helicase